jgi:tungstate transport system substrate-binding protein
LSNCFVAPEGSKDKTDMTMKLNRRQGLLALAGLPLMSLPAHAASQLTLVSTTSTQDSGLLRDLLPRFQADSGIQARAISLGTGQALEVARRGDVDLVLVHAKSEEEAFVAQGYGLWRRPVMYNDFVIAGPRNDPAKLREITDAKAAFERILQSGEVFISRGDRSGTHLMELEIWRSLGVNPEVLPRAQYRPIGQGQGAALAVAGELNAYLLVDRGTWISFRNKRELALFLEGSQALRNQYGVIPVNPARHPHVRASAALIFADWITSPRGQQAIADYRIDGQQLFFPNAGEAGA